MNLTYTYCLLAAAAEQPAAFIRLASRKVDNEVRLMAKAGLVDATFHDDGETVFTPRLIVSLPREGHS